MAIAGSADVRGLAAAEFGLGKLSVELGDWDAAEAHYGRVWTPTAGLGMWLVRPRC